MAFIDYVRYGVLAGIGIFLERQKREHAASRSGSSSPQQAAGPSPVPNFTGALIQLV
jgi:hypothetical protein